jgi:hypothetical protein
MLPHLHQRIATLLAQTRAATLATHGPAGLQAHVFPCEACALHLLLLLPCTSDHLFNISYDPLVVATTAHWQMRGNARPLNALECQRIAVFQHMPDAPWSTCIVIQPLSVSIAHRSGWGNAETIDLDEGATKVI